MTNAQTPIGVQSTTAVANVGQLVAIEGGRDRKLHTDEDCMALKTPNPRPASSTELERLEDCQHCAGTIDHVSGRGNRPGQSLEEMTVEQFDEHLTNHGLR